PAGIFDWAIQQSQRLEGAWHGVPDPDERADGQLAQTRVEGVTQPIAYEVDGEDGEDDRETGKEREPPGAVDVLHAIEHHPPPGWGWRWDAQAKKAQAGLEDDHIRHHQRGDDDNRRRDIRQHVTPDDPQVRCAERPRGID